MEKSSLSYFTWAFIVTAAGLALGAWLGWNATGTLSGMLSIFFICAVLAVLEISLSFDNAIVNANKLKEMTPVWQRRFLTWGILGSSSRSSSSPSPPISGRSPRCSWRSPNRTNMRGS
jgi:uncharacterized protein